MGARGENLQVEIKLENAVCVVFTSNRSFYSTSVHPVCVLIIRPKGIPGKHYVVTDGETVNKKNAINRGKPSEMLAYRIREDNQTSPRQSKYEERGTEEKKQLKKRQELWRM